MCQFEKNRGANTFEKKMLTDDCSTVINNPINGEEGDSGLN